MYLRSNFWFELFCGSLPMGRLHLHLKLQIRCRTTVNHAETIFEGGFYFNLWSPFEVDHDIDRLFRVTLFGDGRSVVSHSQDGEWEV